MNLWVKRVGQTIFLWASALFFFSCEDDNKLLGYKARDRFNVQYAEIPIESSVYQFDSLITTNFNSESEIHRLLVGTYEDPRAGKVTAEAYAQLYRTTATVPALPSGTYDSASIQLSFDLSHFYGSSAASAQQIAIYELDDTLAAAKFFHSYYNSSTVAKKPSPVGSKTFTVNPAVFDQINSEDTDTTVTIRFPLSDEFGQRIFEMAKQLHGRTEGGDTLYNEFRNTIKGIAISPENCDKIVSFNPLRGSSKIVIHFHDPTATSITKDSVVFGFGGLMSFNNIQADRSSSDLAELTSFYAELPETLDKRYIQNGTGVTTKLDLENFLKFTDTVSGNIIINSAELVIKDVESDLEPPGGLGLRILNESNRFRKTSRVTQEQAQEIAYYNDAVFLASDNLVSATYAIMSDADAIRTQRTSVNLTYDDEANSYNGFMTLFLQELYYNYQEGDKPVFSKTALFSVNPSHNKSVSRAVFSKDIKLKITYTKSLNSNQ